MTFHPQFPYPQQEYLFQLSSRANYANLPAQLKILRIHFQPGKQPFLVQSKSIIIIYVSMILRTQTVYAQCNKKLLIAFDNINITRIFLI